MSDKKKKKKRKKQKRNKEVKGKKKKEIKMKEREEMRLGVKEKREAPKHVCNNFRLQRQSRLASCQPKIHARWCTQTRARDCRPMFNGPHIGNHEFSKNQHCCAQNCM